MNLKIIDAIAPFFVGYEKRVVNWSKIPFGNLEQDDHLDPKKTRRVVNAFSVFLERISDIGYNAISLDDLAHLVSFDYYPENLAAKLEEYHLFYQTLFRLAKRKNLKIFVNTDIIPYTSSIKREVGGSVSRSIRFLQEALVKLFSQYPVDGVIARIGESDGTDVVGDFISRLCIKTPRAANRLIRELLPVFEDFGRLFIFRTWTVGSYRIGDLIWNEETFKETFKGITSSNFIVSMKYGDTDFFSKLEVNPLFYRREQQTILELQARRERECFGTLPYYVGWDYERYHRKLRSIKNLVGISVWCQTGGWSRNNQLTFLDGSSVWNELNTVAALKLFTSDWDASEGIRRFFPDSEKERFLKEFHDLFYRILYPAGFSDQSLYFRRTRIPPLIWLSWDYISINPFIKTLYRVFNPQRRLIGVSREDLNRVRKLGIALQIDNADFYCDTLQLLYYCSCAVTGELPINELEPEIEAYQKLYPHCNLKFQISQDNASQRWLERVLPLLIRQSPHYRLIDRLMLTRVVSWIQLKLMLLFTEQYLPKYANKRAMRPEVLFK